MNKDIFVRRDEIAESVDEDKIKASIPKAASETRREGWDKLGFVEWRWRFLKLPEGKKVEISRTYPVSSVREYLNCDGHWVRRKVSAVFDDYVTKTYYYYADFD